MATPREEQSIGPAGNGTGQDISPWLRVTSNPILLIFISSRNLKMIINALKTSPLATD